MRQQLADGCGFYLANKIDTNSGGSYLLDLFHALLHVVSDILDELVDSGPVFLQTPLGLSNSLRADLPQLLRGVLHLTRCNRWKSG